MSFAGNATPSDQKGYTTLLFLLLPPDLKNEARRGYCGGGCYQAISCRGLRFWRIRDTYGIKMFRKTIRVLCIFSCIIEWFKSFSHAMINSNYRIRWKIARYMYFSDTKDLSSLEFINIYQIYPSCVRFSRLPFNGRVWPLR